MDLKEILTFIIRVIMVLLVLSGGWILLHWGFDMVTMDDPPTLMESAQSFLDFWVEKYRMLPWGKREEIPRLIR